MRPIWSGIIGFGLVNIPIKIYSASEERGLNFHYLRKGDLCPIKYNKVCQANGEEVPYKDIVKGYEFEKGRFVIFEEEDFKKISPRRSQMIEILEFVKRDEIDPMLIEKPYYIEPEKNAGKAYAILSKALGKSDKVGIAKFVMHTKEYLVMIAVDRGVLILNQLRYVSQLRKADELQIPAKVEVTDKETDMALQLIGQLSGTFKAEKYKDTYSSEIRKMVEQKMKGKAFEVRREEMPMPTALPDLMAKLKESLELAQKEKARK